MTEEPNKPIRYAMAVLAMGVLGRLITWTLLQPFSSRPRIEWTYTQAAQDILRFNFHALGDRVPVYPLLIALCGVNLQAISIAQSVLGVAASLMIFDMAFRRTRHGLFSLLVGLSCSFVPELLLSESMVMTEALTNFLIVTSVWLVARYDGVDEGNVWYPLAVGSLITLAGLTRPLMLCLVPVYYCFLVPLWPPSKILRREAMKKSLLFLLPVAVFVFGWCGFNYLNNGYFSPTTRAGQQIMDQVDPYVYLAPDRYAVPRDVWLEARQQAPPRPNSTLEDAYRLAAPEMQKRTGETEIQVSHEFATLALYLQLHHPLFCLRRVEQGWIQFWGQPNLNEVDWPESGKIDLREFASEMSKFLIRELKATFLVLALLSWPFAFFRLKVFTKIEYLIFAVALSVSLFGAFTEFGDNRRFCVPLYMVILYTILTRGWVWITASGSKDPTATV